jgi:cytochrome c oxidase subunit 1
VASVSIPLERGGPEPLPVRTERADRGLRGWLVTVDHKRIGVLYLALGILGLVEGGILALLIRLQLSRPDNRFLSAETYNQVLTMHGVIMIFFAATPIIWGIINYVLPLLIGARDVAFPRLNMFTFWLTLGGFLLLDASFLLGGAPDVGWYAYLPLSSVRYAPGVGTDAYVVSLLMGMAASAMAGINFLVTVFAKRAPGMTLMKLPPMAWFSVGASAMVVTAGIPFVVALLFLGFQRWFGAGFFAPAQGGDAMLWMNLFWMFGHPEVYILALPELGIICEVLATFSRKPLFGYGSMVAAVVAVSGPMSWIVWVHHFFVGDLGASANVFYSTTTELISVPMAMLVFNWIGTVWDGDLRLTTPMLYALGAVFMFLVGGLTGIVNGNSVGDRQVNDTYWIVGHFHFVILGTLVPTLLAGITYWWPKVTGRMMSERLGKAGFWTTFVGLQVTFVPQMILGMDGMPRRIFTYLPWQGWGSMNLVSTVGAFILALGVGIFAITMVASLLSPATAPADPWDGRTLEWAVPSPAPAYNFARLPQVEARDPVWRAKVQGDGPVPDAPADLDLEREPEGVHMPSPSAMPLLAGLGVTVAGLGAMLHALPVALAGLAVLAAGALGWALEDARGYYLAVEGEGA